MCYEVCTGYLGKGRGPLVYRIVVVVRPMATVLTSAAGFPANDMHSSSISLSSVVTRKSPCTILGGSGGTRTVRVANLDRIPGSPEFPGLTWHWYRASSSSMTGKISREKSPAKGKTEKWDMSWCEGRTGTRLPDMLDQGIYLEQCVGIRRAGGHAPCVGLSGSFSHSQRASMHRSMEDKKERKKRLCEL